MKLSKVYEPSAYESDIYALWEKSEAFAPKKGQGSYSIVMPPPNANGNLHIGHALTFALEDIAIRYHRLKGEEALLLPGADHAGFETQVVYEKELAKQGKSRFDLARDDLYSQIWDFVQQNRDNFDAQLRALGISCDWSRFTFTLDEKVVKRAYSTFKKMWDEGLIYRGTRLVNFCTFHGTGFADIEVQYKEVKGKLWYINYPLTDGSGQLTVATTRPETMLGDVAVAVHPDDERYKNYIGKTVMLPLTQREIPVIADDFVETEFGTGAVKITPAHDPNDFDAAERHDLPKMSVIDHEGKLTHKVPEAYRGLGVEEARTKIVEDLEREGVLEKIEDYTHNVGHCYKCGTVIQPLLREQWFVDMQPLAKEAIAALKADKITFYPDAKKDQLIGYLENLRDWNISRQIAWGIPIPAFQNVDNPDDWIYNENVSDESVTVNGKTYRRDPDVFDTWFSSSSWPYATLDYPDGDDFKTFYPLSLMETGGEIMYPWVSRMIMLGLYITGQVPFEAVYVHGYVMAEDGTKMSKSVGNVIDPMEAITQYGSDALRMGIITGRTAAINRGYDRTKVEAARNFCNKLWNMARYIEDKLGDTKPKHAKAESMADHWVLERLRQGSDKIAKDLDNYRFAEAYDTLYHLVWDDVADWYIEASKVAPNNDMLAHILETILTLAHPFAPFVTETIWQTLSWHDDLLINSSWPHVAANDKKLADDFEEIREIVSEIRNIRSILKMSENNLYYTDVPFLAANAELIKRLTGLQDVQEVSDGHGLQLTSTKYRCWIDVDPATARDYTKELADKKLAQEKVIAQLKARLENKAYADNAPKEVVEQSKQQLAEAEELLAKLSKEFERFSDYLGN